MELENYSINDKSVVLNGSSSQVFISDQQQQQQQHLQQARGVLKCNQPIRVLGVQEESCIAWSPDGRILAFVSGNASIYITREDNSGNFQIENILIGHKNNVQCLLFHPTESILVSGGYDGIIVWDYMKGFIIKKIFAHIDHDAHESAVECLTWIFEGSALVSGGKDSNIKIWDSLKGFKLLETVTGHKASVMCFAICGSLLASAGRDSSVKLWDINSLRQDSREKRDDDSSIKVSLHTSFDGHRGDVVSLAFNKDASIIISGARDNEIKLWNIKANELLKGIKHHKGDVTQVVLLYKDSILLSSSVDGTLKCLKLGKQNIFSQESDVIALEELKQETSGLSNTSPVPLLSIDTSIDIDLPIPLSVISGISSKEDDEKDRVLYSFEAHEGSGIADFAVNPVYPLLATSSGRTVRIWRISSGGVTSNSSTLLSPVSQTNSSTLSVSDKPVLFHEFTGHKDSVNAVFLLPEGDTFVSGSTDYHVFLYNIKSMKKEADFNFEGSVYTLAVGSKNDQRVVFVGGNHYDIKGFCINKEGPGAGKEVVRYQGHSGQVQALALNKDCSLLVSGGYDFDLFVWAVKMPFIPRDESIVQKPHHKYSAHKGHITGISFSEDDQYLVTSSTDHSLILWNVSNSSKKLTKYRTLEYAHGSVISSVVFGRGSSSNLYFSGCWEGIIKVWDLVKKDKPIHEIKVFDNRVANISVSSDGKILLASSSTGLIKTFSASSPFNQIAQYTPNDNVCTNSLSSTSDFFVSSSENGMIRCWSHPNNPDYQNYFQQL